MPSAYAFEIKSIQRLILEGGKLRDIAGGSAIIAGICDYPEEESVDLLELLLSAADFPGELHFSRRAAGAFACVSENSATIDRLRPMWTLLMQQRLPGALFVDAIGQGADEASAMEAARDQLLANESRQFPFLPSAGPLVRRCPATGGAATEICRITGELIDEATLAKRSAFAEGHDPLTRKFVSDSGVYWPVNMDPLESTDPQRTREPSFPFVGEQRDVGVVHADGNRLGQLLISLLADLKEPANRGGAGYGDLLLAFSRGVAKATRSAVRSAVQEQLPAKDVAGAAVMPARPIVLGGDDLTIIVRADLALEFTAAFLASFKQETAKAFAYLRKVNEPAYSSLPAEGLSAGAGVVFVKASQPFHLAYDLAESLASHAKEAAKKSVREDETPPSLISFHRIVSPAIDDYDTIQKKELRATWNGREASLSLNPYAVLDPAGRFPKLDDLQKLRRFVEDDRVARGPLRELVRIIQEAPADARRRYKRWREVMEEVQAVDGSLVQSFDQIMASLKCESTDSPFTGGLKTPLLDALNWSAAAKIGSEDW